MASSHQTVQPAEEPIEPDDDIPAEVDNQQHYGDQRPPYWYRICPGGFLIPPPLPPSSEQHHGFPPAQGPPVDGGLVHAQPDSGQHQQATQDGQARGTSQEPAVWGSQTGVTNAYQSSEPTTASQGATTALQPNSEPQSPDRQRCEVWPLTYRTANGWFKVFWCVQIDGQSHYLDQPPDLQELSRRYHLVYFPDLASHDAQVNNQ